MKRSPTSWKKRGFGSPHGALTWGQNGDPYSTMSRTNHRPPTASAAAVAAPSGARSSRSRPRSIHSATPRQATRGGGAQGAGAREPGQRGQVVGGLVELAHRQRQGDQGGDREQRRHQADLEVAQPAP